MSEIEVKAPERIRVAQDEDGFWTCREAVSGSQEYVRADIYDAALVERKAEPVKKGWRVFENIFRGEWGIEDLGDPDGDAILPPKRIDREHLDRIVSAYNAALSPSPSPVGESRDGLIERLVRALEAAQELAKVAEGLTSCRSDDEFVWGVQEKINTALSAAKEQQP